MAGARYLLIFGPDERLTMGKRQLRRMAERMVKRARLSGEDGVTVSFGFSSLGAAIVIGLLDELPYVGLVMTFLTFGVHRIVLVTDQNTYVFRDRPFHRPGEVLGRYPHGSGEIARKRGKLTFPDGQVVWHSPLFAARAKRVADAANVAAPSSSIAA
jgi:hypothetical protein